MKGVLTGHPSMAGCRARSCAPMALSFPRPRLQDLPAWTAHQRPLDRWRSTPPCPARVTPAAGRTIDEAVRGCESAGAVTAAAAPFAERGKGCPLRPSSG
jgi:hypothetical protein